MYTDNPSFIPVNIKLSKTIFLISWIFTMSKLLSKIICEYEWFHCAPCYGIVVNKKVA